jgi:hypothetical protein
MAYEIPPEYEPRDGQIPRWATDMERFRICFAITRLIAQRDDPIFCKQLYDDDRVVTDDVDIAEPGPLPSHSSG